MVQAHNRIGGENLLRQHLVPSSNRKTEKIIAISQLISDEQVKFNMYFVNAILMMIRLKNGRHNLWNEKTTSEWKTRMVYIYHAHSRWSTMPN